jgi:hypothetical protein
MDPQNEAPNPTTPQRATLALDDAATTALSPHQPALPPPSPQPSRLSPSPRPSRPSPSPPPDGIDDDLLTAGGNFWVDPLQGIDPGSHGAEEEPIRRYIEDVPGPDEHDDWPLTKVQSWLDTPTASLPYYFLFIYLS